MIFARGSDRLACFCIFLFLNQMIIDTAAIASSGNDEAAIRQQAQEYARLFAAAETDKLSALWDDNAVFVDQFGNSFKGKSAIRNQYLEFFSRNAKQPLEISVKSIEFPAENMAIEQGTSRLSGASAITEYIATHAKKNGKWLIETVTETPDHAKSNSEYLKPISWLSGEWKAEGNTDLIVKFDWVNENILSCKTDAKVAGASKQSHNEFIYWNPLMSCINSWQFDSEGGVARKWWEKSSNAWVIHAVAIQADGTLGRADYIVTQQDNNDSFVWQSCKRSLAGVDLPDTKKMKFNKVKS